ncbi:LysR family transcriptional regulator [Ferrimonas lipolytica]|uniref:LysR family transcriptional regulator n=1 Tax=Ferrimonas lipolytica TaxID=2724191 RepID=A0A6H1UD37_9GAMM|nr:LysR family transcriptional regulator [Ferrimonas lipolytica]QIZ76954.1 LysR family transcriptional regulator [Ferrimonas lipolytica]
MELEELYRRDLSLLIALQVLLEERSVTKAAQRLHLSQSATSRILSRLRQMLDDPLFNRVGQRLEPTEFALECERQLQQPIAQLSNLFSPKTFSPQSCQQRFTIAVTDFAMQACIPLILKRLYQQAPQLRLEITPVQQQELLAQLSIKGVDVAICRDTNAPAPLNRQELGQVGVRCLVAADHPLAQEDLTECHFSQYQHAIIAVSDGVKALLDDAMMDYGVLPPLIRSPNLDSTLAVLPLQAVMLIMPSGMAEMVAQQHQLVVKTLPFTMPRIDYQLFWHSRTEYDPGQRWLREQITLATQSLLSGELK